MKKIFTLLFLSAAFFAAKSQSTTVVISQVYGGGGGSTGTYLYDYIELHNVSAVAQSLEGFSLQYGSATGRFASTSTNLFVFPAGTTIAPGGYLLVQSGTPGTAGAPLPVTADFTATLTLSGASGKIALSNMADTLGCGATAAPCTLPSATIVDLVAYGTSNNAEGGVSANNGVALTSVQGVVRKDNGCTDTDNNNNDFDVVTAPIPRSLLSTVNICSGTVPIRLEYIKGQKSGSGVAINWKVTCLSTNIVMEIERAADTKNFKSITSIAATQARCAQPFDFTDALPLQGKNFYRLKMIDVDGKIYYSPIVAILNGSKDFYFAGIYPGLVESETVLSVYSAKAGNIETVITDISGRVVKTSKQSIPTGASLIKIDCSTLARGIYNISGVATGASIRFVKL